MRLDSTQQQEVGPAAMPPADLWECLDGLANVVAKGLAELVAPHNLIPLEYTLLNAFLRKEAWPTMELVKRLAVKMPRTSRQDDCKVFPHNGICSQPVYPAKAGIHSFNLGVLLSPGRTARIEQLCNRPAPAGW